jgi:hypothetical protein
MGEVRGLEQQCQMAEDLRWLDKIKKMGHQWLGYAYILFFDEIWGNL